MILIDTSAWIFALRKNFHPYVKDRVDKILAETDVAITGIIKLELLGGTKTEREFKRLKKRLDRLYYIDATEEVWDKAAELAFTVKRKGVTVPFTDIFIASTSIESNTVLLHADSHFDTIAKHSKLEVESLVSRIS